MKTNETDKNNSREQETDREKEQERELRKKRWLIAILLVLAVVLALTVVFLLLTRGVDKVEKSKVDIISVNDMEIVIPVTINKVRVNCVIDRSSRSSLENVMITNRAASAAGCKVEGADRGSSYTRCSIRFGDRVVKDVCARVCEGHNPEIRISLGWLRHFVGKVKVKDRIAVISGNFTGQIVDAVGNIVNVTGYSEGRVGGFMLLTVMILLLIFYSVARVLMSKDMLVITIGGFDKCLIFVAAFALLVSVIANIGSGGETVAAISLGVAGVTLVVSVAMTVMANIAHPICMMVAVFAKIFVVLGLLLLMLVLLLFLIISVVITMSNRGSGEWEEIGWSDTLDAYVGIRR